MRYPVTHTGSKEDFNKDWYIASGYGEARKNFLGVVTYYHEGLDINLRTGGDSDLNQELKSIANGRVVYYHESHASTSNTFGRHHVVEIKGAWGTRWVHYAHCSNLDFIGSEQDVSEGQIISRVGKSGTTSAHLHFAIFKVDPKTLPKGIDTIAKTVEQLKDWWEEPIAFIEKYRIETPNQPVITDQTKIPQIVDANGNAMEVQAIRGVLNDQRSKISELQSKILSAKQILG